MAGINGEWHRLVAIKATGRYNGLIEFRNSLCYNIPDSIYKVPPPHSMATVFSRQQVTQTLPLSVSLPRGNIVEERSKDRYIILIEFYVKIKYKAFREMNPSPAEYIERRDRKMKCRID